MFLFSLVIVVSFDLEIVCVGGVMIGVEVCVKCFNVLFVGGVNLMCDLWNGCNFEYFGEDLLLVGELVGVYIVGV